MIDSKTIRQVFVLLLIVAGGTIIFREMLTYFSGVLGAITIYVLFKKYMVKLVRLGWNSNIAAGFLMLIFFLIILIPVTGIIFLLSNKIDFVLNNSEDVLVKLHSQIVTMEQKYGYDITSQVDFNDISTWLSNNISDFAGGTFDSFISIAIMYFLLFYMFTNRQELRESLFDYIPISIENLKVLGREAHGMVRSNAIGIPLVAIAQGFVALIGFLIFGIENPFFWGVIVCIGSMIPFVGNLLGTIPVFILSLSNGNAFQAWAILLYGLIVVGTTDNLIRLFILRKLDNVHPLITLIGVIIGIPLFGFIGLIFGPLLVSLFLIVVRIYKKEYGRLSSNDSKVL
jgi:predicted PurR-regulated permease PerM